MFTIFKTFFWLGWISFGGPAAHIGYFRNTFVAKLKWLDDKEYGQIVALSQFLPGPGSSQVGFALGYKKGGILGAFSAFVGFTLPSVLIMLLLAIASSHLTESGLFLNIIHGLKLLAVVVVADATWGMYKNFCRDKISVTLCLITAVALLLLPGIKTQLAVLVFAGFVGFRLLRDSNATANTPFKPSTLPLIIFALLLFGLPTLAPLSPMLEILGDFFQAGSLVFGGGHVVLPLLQNLIGDQISQDAFLTGYATAQAVPGPMFTFATYIGYHLTPSSPILGAILATVGIFLPGFLLLLGVLNNWQSLALKPNVSGIINGVNAAVVGLLGAALYQPVFTSAVYSNFDIAMVLVGFFLLKQAKLPIVGMVLFFITTGILR